MKTKIAAATVACTIVLLLALALWLGRAPATPLQITVYETSPGLNDPGRIPRFDVFELTFVQSVDYGGQKNFFDVDTRVVFTAPVSRTQITVGGFYYDTLTDGNSLWKVRFAPSEVGTWTYSYTRGTGSFDVTSSSNPGFLRQNPRNPFRWELDNSQPFVPIGTNDCIAANDLWMMDGGDRRGAFTGGVRTDEHFEAFSQARFNIFRFSQDNCGPLLTNSQLDTYDKYIAQYFDWLMQQLHACGFHIFYSLFSYLLSNNPKTPPPPEISRFIDYSINRWGAYVDIWELQNECTASDEWIRTLAQYLRTRDPYQHPITTSWQRPDLNEIDINAPHWYAHENELQ